MDVLSRIKRLVSLRRVAFTLKADLELEADSLTRELVYEAIESAPAIEKSLRSRNPRTRKRETLYVIKGITLDGITIYTKGTIREQEGGAIFYVLVSSKRSTDD